jgi:hypothetical protein
MVAQLAIIDWSRTNPDWKSMSVLVDGVNEQTGVPLIKLGGAGRNNRACMLAYLRKKLGLTPMLAAQEPAVA